MLSRRSLMQIASASVAASSIAGCAPGLIETASDRAPLRALAARSGRSFGSEVLHRELKSDPAYADLIKTQCAEITPGLEFKWGVLQPTQFRNEAGPAEWLLNWAEQAGLRIRGHTLLWHRNQPSWALKALLEDAQAVTDRRVSETVAMFKGRIAEWDVVNEAIEPKDGRPDGLRNSIFLDELGPDFIGRAFHLAREADPKPRLYYNEYGIESANDDHRQRRAALLGLLTRLKKEGAPIDGVGIQGHLHADTPMDVPALRHTLKEIGQMGLTIRITELDIRDHFAMATRFGDLKNRAADATRRYMDIVLDEPAVVGVTTWGLADRYTDLKTSNPFDSPLPYDDELRAKPMRTALAKGMQSARPCILTSRA